jgi:phosphoribosyl 1,2-cyclic phosphodiesterase
VALARLLGIPVYLTSLTAPGIAWGDFAPKLETFQAGQSFSIGDIGVTSFTVPHDAADPVGFCFRAEGLRIGIATDLGYLPESVRYHLRGADFLLLESNHDIEMLKVGPYPWAVKQRVMGRNGHLSNDVACNYIRESLGSATTTLVLGHLSAHNNHPALVEQAASQALAAAGSAARLVVAEPGVQSEIFEF